MTCKVKLIMASGCWYTKKKKKGGGGGWQMFQIVVSLPQPTADKLLHLSDSHIIQNIVCYLSSPCRYIFKLYFLNAA